MTNRLYIWSGMCILSTYLTPVILGIYTKVTGDEGFILTLYLLISPVIIGIINLIIAIRGRKSIDRNCFLGCSLIIKYSMIPYFMFGVIMLFFAAILTFVPVPFMIFVGPFAVVFVLVYGWIMMVQTAPFAIAYMISSYREGVHGIVLTVLGCICQFFFSLDVISIMVLALKEKKYVKLTVAVFSLILAGIVGYVLYVLIRMTSRM